jgi:hypothetical protein
MASVRLCACGKELSIFSRASTTACDQCRSTKKTKVLKEEGLVLVHSCLSDAKHDQYVVGCICRKTVTKEESLALIKCGECISLTTREYQFDGGPIIYVGGHGKTPRSPTIEANHILYGVGSMAPSKKKRKTETRAIEELLQLREEDRASRAEEARVRWDEYHRLNCEWMASVTKEYSDEDFFAYDKANFGRQWLGQPGDEDQRTKGGIGIDDESKRRN